MKKGLLLQIEKQLKDQQGKLEHELTTLTDVEINGRGLAYPQYGNKEDENAAEVATFSDNLSLQQSLKQGLRDIKKALERIKTGTYGVCKYCHQEIDERRLKARPESGSCISCKNKRLANK